MSIFEELQQAIIDGKSPRAKELTEKGLGEGIKPSEFFPKAIIPAMNEVGRRMRECEFFIPEVLISARAARASTDILRPLLVGDESVRSAGTVVCGTVKGDLHDIGKNIVAMMLESAGFHPGSVRRTSRALGLQTEAAYRFERGVDPEGAVAALDRAARERGRGIHAVQRRAVAAGAAGARCPAADSIRIRLQIEPRRAGRSRIRCRHIFRRPVSSAFQMALVRRLGSGISPPE